MEDLLLRRRIMMNTDYHDPYISDGLVLHLDGGHKGTNAARWESLVGTSYISINTTICTVENNAIVTNGANGLLGSNPLLIKAQDGTVELCGQVLTPVTNGFIFSSNNNSAQKPLSIVKIGNGFMYSYARFANNTYNFANIDNIISSPFSVSMNGLTGLLNGVAFTSTSENGYNNTPFIIGAKTTGGTLPTNIRIFSIRMYDRQLSQAEILHNLKVDNERFSLGLTLQ